VRQVQITVLGHRKRGSSEKARFKDCFLLSIFRYLIRPARNATATECALESAPNFWHTRQTLFFTVASVIPLRRRNVQRSRTPAGVGREAARGPTTERAIDERTIRHLGYAVSLRKRWLVESRKLEGKEAVRGRRNQRNQKVRIILLKEPDSG
jgi:hypothetical protein